MSTLTPKTTEPRLNFSPALFGGQITHLTEEMTKTFQKQMRSYALFHISFAALGTIQLTLLLLFFPLFAKTSLAAISLATFLLTLFAYFVIRFYLEAKKPEQFIQIKENFLQKARLFVPLEESHPELRHRLIEAANRFVTTLEGQEYNYYPLAPYLQAVAPLAEKLSLWCHWKDVHEMQEMMTQFAVQQYLELIRKEPLHVELHAALARTYTQLYKLYLDPRKIGKKLPYSFIAFNYEKKEVVEKFQKSAGKALEELRIIRDLNPQNTSIYSQVAAIYHDLNLPEKEIEAQEMLWRSNSRDTAVLFRLGVLYFSQGRMAEGLKMYEELRLGKDARAEKLIEFYTQR